MSGFSTIHDLVNFKDRYILIFLLESLEQLHLGNMLT